MSPEIPVVFAADDSYAVHLGVTITSLIENACQSKYNIIILDGGITERNKARLSQICEIKEGHQLTFMGMGDDFSDLATRAHFSTPIYYRLKSPEILPYKKLIYLDCDLIVNTDLADLYEIDMSENIIAAVCDGDSFLDLFIQKYSSFQQLYFEQLELTEAEIRGFINSGVMLINTDAWKKHDISSKAISFAQDYQSTLGDQDALNFLCRNNIFYLDREWNTTTNVLGYYHISPLDNNTLPKIIHYAGGEKPWNSDMVPWREQYWRYFSDSPWGKCTHDLILELGEANRNLRKELLQYRKKLAGFQNSRVIKYSAQLKRAFRLFSAKQ